MNRPKQAIKPLIKGMILALLGICLTATIVGAPVGVFLILWSGRPLGKLVKQWMQEDEKEK